MKDRGLAKKARSFLFRRKMCKTLNILEDDIRSYLLSNEKDAVITGGLRISVKDGGQVEVIELPPLNLEQIALPLKRISSGKEA